MLILFPVSITTGIHTGILKNVSIPSNASVLQNENGALCEITAIKSQFMVWRHTQRPNSWL